jgi:hypothetical protein
MRQRGNAYKTLFWGDLEIEKIILKIDKKCVSYEHMD